MVQLLFSPLDSPPADWLLGQPLEISWVCLPPLWPQLQGLDLSILRHSALSLQPAQQGRRKASLTPSPTKSAFVDIC